MKITGTVEFRDLEGGVWQLAADDGKRYTLLGSRGELKSAKGQRVEVEGSLDDGAGIAMAGPQLRVDKLRKL
jgi:hypothetical protein